MNLTEKDKEALRKALEFENSVARDEWKLGWTWDMVKVWPATLNRLIQMGFLEIVMHSNSYRGMKLTDDGRAIAERLVKPLDDSSAQQEDKVSLSPDIFDDIIGHEEIKELIKASLAASKPVHVLLVGPPALAKSLFLWDIEQSFGEKALWLVGSATSKAGLWDLVAEKEPQVILIDELDKIGAADIAGLLSLMEGGKLSRAKVGRRLEARVEPKVIAAANSTSRLSPELLSRFAVRKVHSYSREDFRKVVKGVLVRHEGLEPEAAEEIANRLDGKTQDVRDAVRVARLSPQLGIKRSMELLLGA
jgi:Holliday junction DNA helicase RuvB